jgi:amino acid adenylation domain-containing protein
MLADRLRQAAALASTAPLSSAQQRLWFLDQLEPNTPLYNLPAVLRLKGHLDVAALQRALDAVVARHESLRTRFVPADGDPAQVVDPPTGINLARHDLSAGDASARQTEAQRLLHEEVTRPFNLSADQLLRAALFRLEPDEHLLALTMHHIISDEWSIEVLFRDLGRLYEAFVGGGGASPLPPLPIQYADYAVWQRQWLRGETYERQLRFWKDQMAENPPVLELPCDHPRPSLQSFRGATRWLPLGTALSPALKQLASRSQCTLFIVLLAAFKALLYRYTRQEDLVVATPIAGRTRVETEDLIGFFVNTLPMRTRLSGRLTFKELLARTRHTALNAFAHQDLPFEKLVEALRPERSLDHLPFTRIMFLFQNHPLRHLRWPGLEIQFIDTSTDTAKFDITFGVQDTGQNLAARIEYNTSLFDASTIERLVSHFETLLQGIAANPELPLSNLPLLSRTEQHQLLVEWNQTRTDYPRDHTIHDLFAAQAAREPQAVAAVFGDESITYAELDARAGHLAALLQTEFQVGKDVPVGICVDRSVAMVVGLVAILKAGGAYVPLDPAYPKERLAFMLADTQAPVLLTQQKLLSLLPESGAQTLLIDGPLPKGISHLSTDPLLAARPSALAYIMYTSGSTGLPKGVAVPHRAVIRLVRDTNYIRLDATDRVAQVANVSFDAATLEIWGSLLNGACVVGIPQDVVLSPADFARALRDQRITAMFLTAALFNQVASQVPGAFEMLRTLIVGGEALDPNWVRAVLNERPPQRLVNGYGPTENTTFTCCHLIRTLPEDATNVPIGRPISNTQVYILDPDLNPVPIGVRGELYAGGDGLARGYWKRPELTAGKFIPNPFDRNTSEYLYKTGDLARYLPDGRIEFLGRIDQQVKIRGFRIELGEIEAALGRHPAIQECAVTVWEDGPAGKRLAAYFVPGPKPPSAADLRAFLRERLPDYMLPAAFVPLDALPLTPNGKLDRQALPRPGAIRPESQSQRAAPRDAVETRLVEIWEAVLGVRPIGITDRFFDLGGHSLLAVRLMAQIEKAFSRKLRLATVFQACTVEQLAAILRDEVKEASVASGTSLVAIQPRGSRPPLYLVHGAGGGMFWGYANLSRHLGPNQPVYGFKSRGLDGREEFSRIERMAAEYLSDLRTVQPHGPYLLGGYCFGGAVAYEMARQLEARGESVALVALMNSVPPNSRYARIPWSPAWALRFVRNLRYWTGYFLSWTAPQRRGFFHWKWGQLKKKVGKLRGRDGKGLARVDVGDLVDLSAFTPEESLIWEAHIRALLDFHPEPFPGRVHLFRSSGHPLWCSFDRDYGWGDLALAGVKVVIVPGAHERILEEPFVQTLAGELAKAIDAASGSLPPAQPPLRPRHHPVAESPALAPAGARP